MNRRILVPSILIASLLFALVGFAGPANAQYAASCNYDSVSLPNTVSGEGAQPGTIVTVEADDIASRAKTKGSFMPSAAAQGVQAQDLRDIVEYLKVLK